VICLLFIGVSTGAREGVLVDAIEKVLMQGGHPESHVRTEVRRRRRRRLLFLLLL
jgi:hypothetical protein